MTKRVAIIGAGCSGLTSIKACLEQGLEPVCFERSDDIGGLWNYCAPNAAGDATRPSVYKSCTINTSKEMSSFSDFPMPADFPVFMSHTYVLRYFRMYAEHFQLLQHIRFKHEIISIEPCADFAVTGRWLVKYSSQNLVNSHPAENAVATAAVAAEATLAVHVETFDAVFICTGHHAYKNQPTLYGQENFSGQIMHSSEYRTHHRFEGKKVVVVGGGNSAADISVDLGRHCDKVHMSTRRGAWVIGRMGPLGYPADALANSRLMFSLPMSWLQKSVELMTQFRFHQANYGLESEHRCLEVHPTISDDLPLSIMSGRVTVKGDIFKVDKHGVHFEDGSYEDADAIIMATGYDYRIPFVDKSIIDTTSNRVELYKRVFSPSLSRPTLAVIGLVQAVGSVIPISEIQARWAARVVKGDLHLPSKMEMLDDIDRKQTIINNQYYHSRRHHLQTYWIEYMDEIAAEIDAKPSLPSLMVRDPALGLRCFLGPCVPAQYRLRGEGAWSGAAQSIRQALGNNVTATKTRSLRRVTDKQSHTTTHADSSATALQLLSDAWFMRVLFAIILLHLLFNCLLL